MRPIATPIVGGMVTSTIHVLLVTPVIFLLMKERERKKGRLRASGMKLGQHDGRQVSPRTEESLASN
jgi:hypothetical protein